MTRSGAAARHAGIGHPKLVVGKSSRCTQLARESLGILASCRLPRPRCWEVPEVRGVYALIFPDASLLRSIPTTTIGRRSDERAPVVSVTTLEASGSKALHRLPRWGWHPNDTGSATLGQQSRAVHRHRRWWRGTRRRPVHLATRQPAPVTARVDTSAEGGLGCGDRPCHPVKRDESMIGGQRRASCPQLRQFRLCHDRCGATS